MACSDSRWWASVSVTPSPTDTAYCIRRVRAGAMQPLLFASTHVEKNLVEGELHVFQSLALAFFLLVKLIESILILP